MTVTWRVGRKNLEEAIQKHDLASTKLFSSLDNVTDLTQLNAAELESRALIFQIAADIAEVKYRSGRRTRIYRIT